LAFYISSLEKKPKMEERYHMHNQKPKARKNMFRFFNIYIYICTKKEFHHELIGKRERCRPIWNTDGVLSTGRLSLSFMANHLLPIHPFFFGSLVALKPPQVTRSCPIISSCFRNLYIRNKYLLIFFFFLFFLFFFICLISNAIYRNLIFISQY